MILLRAVQSTRCFALHRSQQSVSQHKSAQVWPVQTSPSAGTCVRSHTQSTKGRMSTPTGSKDREPQLKILEVDGRKTEVYEMLSSTGQSALQVLILPGNPGCAGYYKAYIAALHAVLKSKADIYAVSHLGHASSREACQYNQIVALFPFFQVDLTSGQQQFLYRLTCIPRVMGVLGGLLGALPIAAQRWLVNWWGGGLEDYATEATVGLLNYHTIRNGFHLGHTEFQDLATAVDWKQLQELGNKVAVVCNPTDVWFSKRSWEQMWLEVPQIQAYMEETQRHDFCVSSELSIALAHKTASILHGG